MDSLLVVSVIALLVLILYIGLSSKSNSYSKYIFLLLQLNLGIYIIAIFLTESPYNLAISLLPRDTNEILILPENLDEPELPKLPNRKFDKVDIEMYVIYDSVNNDFPTAHEAYNRYIESVYIHDYQLYGTIASGLIPDQFPYTKIFMLLDSTTFFQEYNRLVFEAAISKLELNKVAFNCPDTLSYDNVYLVQVSVLRSKHNKKLLTKLSQINKKKFDVLMSLEVRIDLYPTDSAKLNVVSFSNENPLQPLLEEDINHWKWTLKPVDYGDAELLIRISSKIGNRGIAKNFDTIKRVFIKADNWQKAKCHIRKYKEVYGSASLGTFGLGVWGLWRGRKKKKKAASKPSNTK